jgi:hypothetical protein
MRRRELASNRVYCFVPARLMVKAFERLQPAALPAPCAVIVDPFNVADADWNVMTTGPQVNWTAGHTRLPDHEAELPLPCAVTEPDPSRQTPVNVAFDPDTATCTSPDIVCGDSPEIVSVAGPAHVPFIAVFRFPPEEPPHASTVAKINPSPIFMIPPSLAG